jgi:hypothetical protein
MSRAFVRRGLLQHLLLRFSRPLLLVCQLNLLYLLGFDGVVRHRIVVVRALLERKAPGYDAAVFEHLLRVERQDVRLGAELKSGNILPDHARSDTLPDVAGVL